LLYITKTVEEMAGINLLSITIAVIIVVIVFTTRIQNVLTHCSKFFIIIIITRPD